MVESTEVKKISDDVSTFKNQLQIANDYAEAIMQSHYGELFKSYVPDPEHEGKQLVTIKKEDIIACILMGRELGLPDMISISFGKTLDRLAYFKVMKGKTLGFDPVTSLQRVFAYEQNGSIITGVDGHGINSVIIRTGVKFDFIKDYEIKKYYRGATKELNNLFLGYTLEENWIVVNRGILPEQLKTELSLGKLPVKEDITYESEVIFYREGWKPLHESYNLLDATDAGLYKGFDKQGNEVKGKPSWNAHPKTILNGRIITIGGRKICDDALNGLYSIEELKDMEISKATESDIPLSSSEVIE